MTSAAILDFQNMEILEAVMVKTAKVRYCAKFRGRLVKPLLRYGDVSIVQNGAEAVLHF